MDSSGGREDDSAHSMVEQKSRVTDAGCKKSSGWSACSLPCQQPGANAVTQQFQLGLPETVTASTTSYCASRSRACVEKKPPCVLDVAPDCSLVKPRYDSPEEALYCHELCNNALTRCREQAALQFQTQWECIMAFINSSGVTGRCQIQKGAVSKTTLRPPVCFLSRTRQVDASKSLSFLTTDKTSGRGSCMCAVTNSVPCSPEEVALSFDDWAKQLGSTVCPFGQLGAFFNSPNSKGSADSFVYFGASDLGRVHCPISKSSDLGSRFPTFTEFESPESMNNFCENGLPFWQEKREPLVDCRQVIPKNASTTDCPGRCHKAVVNCMVSNDSLDNCINEALSAGDFAENCELQSSVKLGKGLMFCKRIRTDCEYSEWSEWSECSRTCRSGGDDEESVRVRGRKLLVAAEHGGSCDADIEDSHGGSLSDVQLCDWLPPCDALADTETYVIMPKPEPKLADWSATRTTTTTVIPDLQNENKILCTIVDMADFSKSHRGYDTETESCKCPYNARVCSRTEAVNSRDNWDELMQTVCESNGQGQILAQGMETFSCSDRVFRSFRGTLGQTPEAHCKSEDATYIFCEDGAIDNDLIFTEVMMSIITGVVMGIAVVYWAIQYSGDVQKVLGLAGRYVELTNLLHEVSQEPQAHEEEKAEEGEGPDEDAEPEAAVEGNSEFDCNPRAKEENGEESEQDASDSESGSDDDDDIVSEE